MTDNTQELNEIIQDAIQQTADYLYHIDGDITPEQYEVISHLRQLINEVFIKEGKQVSNQFIYDNLKEVLR